MRHRGRRDANHAEIVKALRACGCSVLDLGNVGNGCPDLCVARNGFTMLVEVKDGNKPESARRLTEDEQRFIANWKGKVRVVTDWHQAVRIFDLTDQPTVTTK